MQCCWNIKSSCGAGGDDVCYSWRRQHSSHFNLAEPEDATAHCSLLLAMASTPGPPPSTREHGHSGVASVRLRRTSAKSGEAAKAGAANAAVSPSNQEAGRDGRTSAGRAARGNRQREQLFTFQNPRREQLESSTTIAVLRENLSALTLSNQREKALSASLREQVAQLTQALAKLNGNTPFSLNNGTWEVVLIVSVDAVNELETREAEKAEQEKSAELQKQKTLRDREERFLPDIHGGSMLAASTAALQQHTQMEVSYQRKVRDPMNYWHVKHGNDFNLFDGRY
ncbi:unnamed protein product [Phytophthora lilii]|uniref:Unnamed protein product n=1 Tax=Phytophthora lilii TaxID=2077276 RepID=A0A9W6WS79_9STRA|nr:unnamed protein product [Phytophthora lilii]